MMERHVQKTRRAGIALALVLVAAPALAGDRVYLKLDPPIPGDSSKPEHIDILSWSWGASVVGASGQVILEDIVCEKEVDRATPLVMQSVLTKKEFTSATLQVERSTSGKPVTYLRYKLDRCFIKSWSTSGDADDRPMETLSLNFDRIHYEFTRFDEATSRPIETFTGGFDATTGTFLPDSTGVNPALLNLR